MEVETLAIKLGALEISAGRYSFRQPSGLAFANVDGELPAASAEPYAAMVQLGQGSS
jgi:hypothetical protein